jgi:hypothetical protein
MNLYAGAVAKVSSIFFKGTKATRELNGVSPTAQDGKVDFMKRIGIYIISATCIFMLSNAWAGKADVLAVTVQRTESNHYSFSTRVTHRDQGWNHYADKWEILSPDGTVLATRTLYHPHVDEQPFTRSLSDVVIPDNIQTVTIRAHCSLHGFGGREVILSFE